MNEPCFQQIKSSVTLGLSHWARFWTPTQHWRKSSCGVCINEQNTTHSLVWCYLFYTFCFPDNGIREEGAKALCKALITNTSLTKLHFQGANQSSHQWCSLEKHITNTWCLNRQHCWGCGSSGIWWAPQEEHHNPMDSPERWERSFAWWSGAQV